MSFYLNCCSYLRPLLCLARRIPSPWVAGEAVGAGEAVDDEEETGLELEARIRTLVQIDFRLVRDH